ncbi:MAG: glucose dehydrogenase [Nitrospirae bacterium]|nr:MAG: glucose dehydrogenase [Nitrospirota bacterium]
MDSLTLDSPDPAHVLAARPGRISSPITLVPLVLKGLQHPLFITHASGHGRRLFVVEQAGRIRLLDSERLHPTPFLDITAKVQSGGEQGLLGLAFHPRYATNGRYIVNYTRVPDGATVVSEFRVSSDPARSAPQERVLLVIPQPFSNHNGGMVAFGPDGFLYIGTGDGGAGGDPGNHAQNPHDLLGKILRIDVDHGSPYAIPSDNPGIIHGWAGEVYALGLRNPWRFSFDRLTGTLWAGDVGQDNWEEIDVIEKGKNYGWRIMEGMHCYHPPQGCRREQLILPVAEYRNAPPRCAITGGYVYRGRLIPDLAGTYVFGDYCSGEIMGLRNGTITVLLDTDLRIASFGEDERGELYVVHHGGGIYRIIPAS